MPRLIFAVLMTGVLFGAGPEALGREAKERSVVPPDSARCNAKCKEQITQERKDPEAAEDCLIRCMAAERAARKKPEAQIQTK
jgi:hypothetical protein